MSLATLQPERYSGFSPGQSPLIRKVRKSEFVVVPHISIGGDNPKDLVRLYQYGSGRKRRPSSWPLFIVKTGVRNYPAESLTEYLLGRLGEIFGLRMAEVELLDLGGQIRLGSKYFLRKNQTLVHGAEILASFWQTNTSILEEMDRKKLIRKHVYPSIILNALKAFFPQEAPRIFNGYVEMILFDALAGNNDRHLFNWAVVVDDKGLEPPEFSPVYDTSRGLFWNFNEDQIKALAKPGSKPRLSKYLEKSHPKVSWEGEENINHFRLVELIGKQELGVSVANLKDYFSVEKLNRMISLINQEFRGIFSESRRGLITQCLTMRSEEIRNRLDSDETTI